MIQQTQTKQFPRGWKGVKLSEVLDYEQPTEYIVHSEILEEETPVPVLTANKGFIKGYTKELEGICKDLPVIIFDDFTTDLKFVNFPFKVKSSAMKILKLKDKWALLKYIFYQMQTIHLRATTHKRYYLSEYQNLEFLFPIDLNKKISLEKQELIVQAIETQFTRLDAAVKSLEAVRKKLEVYRKAVLNTAFNGKMTEKWRKEQTSLDSINLKEIQTIRMNRFLLSNSKRGKRKDLSFEEWNKKYIVPIKGNNSKLEELPQKWLWVNLGEVFDTYVGATPSRSKNNFWGGNIPWVSSGEVNFCTIFDTKEKISTEGLNNSSTSLHPIGTVLLGMIGEGKTRGQPAILGIESCNNQNSAAIRVSESKCSAKYIYYYLYFVYEKNRKLSSGNNQPALNKKRVQMIPLPIAPEKEQEIIANEIDSKFSVIDKIEQVVEQSLTKAEKLRKSILKSAFEGKLVKMEGGRK